jgi:predicted metalloendopeptidase
MKTTALAALLALSVSGAAMAQSASVAPLQPGLDLPGMDRAVQPGDDFYTYANGAWAKAAVIPPDRSRWGVFAELAEITSARLDGLMKDAGKARAGTVERKVGDYYAAYLDQAAIDAKGLAPLKPTLDRIAAIADKRALAAELGAELRADVDALNATDLYTPHVFGLWVEQDLNDPTRYAPYLLQGGLGMADKENYLSTTPRMVAIREAYLKHLAGVLRLSGAPDPEARAQRVLDLETKIARTHFSRADTGEISKTNNPWAMADFAAKAPGMDWAAYFGAAGLAGQRNFIVWQPTAVTGISALVASEPLSVWKEYLAVRQLEAYADVLPRAYGDERFAFFDKTLNGTPEPLPRAKRAVAATNAGLPEAVGQVYVARYFTAESKAAVQKMVDDIKAAFVRRIDALDWMAPATKAEARRKIATLKVGVGYPDRWIDYSGQQVSATDALGNVQRAEAFNYRLSLAKLGARTIDRGEWAMQPQTVNAVNLPVRNALNFPAAILQAPFFDARNPAALNYGAVGATIGHEISHSFDDTGALFDADGRLKNWWTPDDLAHFQASGKALAEQYSQYRPFPDVALNGELVLGENIADLAGLSAAFDAYRAANGGKEGPPVQGMSGDQAFFTAFAQSWRNKQREASQRQQILVDGHAPAEFRAATVRNLDPWYAAFPVQPGQKLYLAPKDRVRVW